MRTITVTIGGRSYRLVGRAAAIAAMAAVQEDSINRPRLGECRFRFAGEKVKLIVESHFAEITTAEVEGN